MPKSLSVRVILVDLGTMESVCSALKSVAFKNTNQYALQAKCWCNSHYGKLSWIAE